MFLQSAGVLLLIVFCAEIKSVEVSVPEHEVEPKDFGCPLDEDKCDTHCRAHGLQGGYCGGSANMECICFTKEAEIPVENSVKQIETEDVDEVRGFGCPLNKYKCDSHCKGMGRKGGYCGGFGHMTCICVTKESEIPVESVANEVAIEDADRTRGFGCLFKQYECDAHCKGLGRKGGYCGGFAKMTCICVMKQSEILAESVANEVVIEDADHTRGFGCPFKQYQCDAHCKGLGRKGGYCGGFAKMTCICVMKQSEILAESVANEVAIEDADHTRGFGCPFKQYQCDAHCKGLGRKGGYCGGFAKMTCICVMKQSEILAESVANEVAIEDADHTRGFGCPFKQYQCDAHCKGLGRKGGYCGGFAKMTCICVMKQSEILAESVANEVAIEDADHTRGFGCPFKQYQCDAHCKGLGRKGGYCGGFAKMTCICVMKQSEILAESVANEVAIEDADHTRGFVCPFKQYECDAHCKGLGRKGGYCGGFAKMTCICVMKQSEILAESVANEVAIEDADHTRGFGCPFKQYQCDAHCKGLGRKGGYCGGFAKMTCICVMKQSEILAESVANEVAIEDADHTRGFGCPFKQYECDAHCKGLGRKGGYCGGFAKMTCICVMKQSEILAESVANEVAIEDADHTRGFGCPFKQYQCDAHCKGLGRKGGYCGGFAKMTCICVMKQSEILAESVANEVAIEDADHTRGFGCPFKQYQCDAHCKGLGRKGGYCGGFAKMTCICVMKQSEILAESVANEVAIEDADHTRGFGCPFKQYECDAHCKGLGRKGGYCGGFAKMTCICVMKQSDILAESVANKVAIIEDVDKIRGFGCPLNKYKCDSHCKGMGRKGGYCGGFGHMTCICVTKTE